MSNIQTSYSAPDIFSSVIHEIKSIHVSRSKYMYPISKPSRIPITIPPKISSTWCFLIRSLDMHTEKDHASKEGIHIRVTGHKFRKKYTMKAARDAWPDGNEYLSGPIRNESSLLPLGRLLLVIAFNTATTIISSINPEIISFFFIWSLDTCYKTALF